MDGRGSLEKSQVTEASNNSQAGGVLDGVTETEELLSHGDDETAPNEVDCPIAMYKLAQDGTRKACVKCIAAMGKQREVAYCCDTHRDSKECIKIKSPWLEE